MLTGFDELLPEISLLILLPPPYLYKTVSSCLHNAPIFINPFLN